MKLRLRVSKHMWLRPRRKLPLHDIVVNTVARVKRVEILAYQENTHATRVLVVHVILINLKKLYEEKELKKIFY